MKCVMDFFCFIGYEIIIFLILKGEKNFQAQFARTSTIYKFQILCIKTYIMTFVSKFIITFCSILVLFLVMPFFHAILFPLTSTYRLFVEQASIGIDFGYFSYGM